MTETWSNTWVNRPLTATSIQSAINNMKAVCNGSITPIQPDILVIPYGFIEESIASAWRTITRLARKLAEPLKRGRFEQRQRRRAQSVWASRSDRRTRTERQIVGLLKDIEMLEKL